MKKELFDDLLESIKEGGAILKGKKKSGREFHFNPIDIKSLRKRYGLSQEKFAQLLGISIGTLRNWEQGRRKPEGPARVLLKVASKHPDAVLDAVFERKTK
jgi:putative transcriptional regulator